MLDLRGRHVDKAGAIGGYIQASHVPDNLAPLVLDREPVLQDRDLAGEAGKYAESKDQDDPSYELCVSPDAHI